MIRGIPNEIFPLIITTTMENYNVPQILVDEGGRGSFDIMYAELFTNLGLIKKECLVSYMEIIYMVSTVW